LGDPSAIALGIRRVLWSLVLANPPCPANVLLGLGMVHVLGGAGDADIRVEPLARVDDVRSRPGDADLGLLLSRSSAR